MSEALLRVGIIGCGDIAPAHAKAIGASSAVELTACADVVESSAQSLGEEYSAPWTTDLDELLARSDVDLVTVATPASTHPDIIEAAAKSGKAVLCEKPLAVDLESADRIIGACREAGVALSTCFPLRYLGAAQWTRELIASGALGTIIQIRLRNMGDKKDSYWTGGFSGRTVTEWRKSKQASGGGVIITNLIHNLDLARAMTDLEVARAYGEVGTFVTDVEVEDLGVACLRYANDAIGVVEGGSCVAGGANEPEVVVVGEKGQSRFGLWSRKCEVFLREAAAGLPTGEWTERAFEDSAHVAFYDDLAAALRAGKQPPVTGDDGRKALEVVVAIYRSAELGQPVTLPL